MLLNRWIQMSWLKSETARTRKNHIRLEILKLTIGKSTQALASASFNLRPRQGRWKLASRPNIPGRQRQAPSDAVFWDNWAPKLNVALSSDADIAGWQAVRRRSRPSSVHRYCPQDWRTTEHVATSSRRSHEDVADVSPTSTRSRRQKFATSPASRRRAHCGNVRIAHDPGNISTYWNRISRMWTGRQQKKLMQTNKKNHLTNNTVFMQEERWYFFRIFIIDIPCLWFLAEFFPSYPSI